MYAKDWQRIGLAQLQKARLSPNEPSGQEQLSQFLGQTMHAAQQALWELQSQSQQLQENVLTLLLQNMSFDRLVIWAATLSNMHLRVLQLSRR
jgi:hypothetical protein